MITTKLRIKTPATKSFSIRTINKYSKNDLKCFWGRFDFVSKPLANAFIYFIYKRYFIGLAAPFFFVCANDLLMYLSRISFFATLP